MDLEWIRIYLQAATVFISVAAIIYSWQSNRIRATKAENESKHAIAMAELKVISAQITAEEKARATNIGEMRDRMAAAEAAIRHLPTPAAVGGIAVRIEQVHGDMKGLHEAVDGVKGQLEMISGFLLNERGGGR